MSIVLREFIDVLNTQLQTAAISTQIAWPNAVYVPIKGTSYLQVETAGRGRVPMGFGADSPLQWTGTYQVSVYVPRDTGTREQDDIAAKVVKAFPRGLNLPTPQGISLIVEYSSASTPVPFGDWSNLPVEIHWFAMEMP